MSRIQTIADRTTSAGGCDAVRKYILTRFKNGDKLPKVNELSKKVGTSQYAAERVLTELSAEGLIERKPRYGSVLVGEREPQVKRSAVATRSIAFMADELESFLSSEVMRGVEVRCREKDIFLTLLNSDYSAKVEEENLRNLVNNHCRGAIVRVGEHKENLRLVEQVVPDTYPLVLIDRSDDDIKFPCVKMDQEQAAFDATRHLLDLGHTRIAHLTYDEKSRPLLREMEKRKEGYLRALREEGLPVRPEYIQGASLFRLGERPTQTYYDSMGYEPMNRLLLQKERPTAVFLINFYLIFGVLRAIADHGLRVPEDISVICIDDEPLAAHMNPSLTVIAQPLRLMGQVAVNLLLEMMEGNEIVVRQHRLRGQLILRNSTARCK